MISLTLQHPWDLLRPVADFAVAIDKFLRPIVFILSVFLFVLSFFAYHRKKTRRMAFVSLAFLLFSIKWAIKVLDLFLSPGYFFSDASENVFELLIFSSLIIALFEQ